MSREQDASYQPQQPNRETPEWNGQGFDLRVTVKDGKTGELLRYQPYNRHCVGRFVYYERPIGSGNLYYGDGKPAGRWVKGDSGEFYADTGASHIDFAAPEQRRLTVEAMQSVEQENEALRAELAALKAEAASKTGEAESDTTSTMTAKERYEHNKKSQQS